MKYLSAFIHRLFLGKSQKVQLGGGINSVKTGKSNKSAKSAPVECNPDFVNMCGLCIPSCGHIDLNSPKAASYAVDEVSHITSAVIGTIGAILLFVISLIRRKEMSHS